MTRISARHTAVKFQPGLKNCLLGKKIPIETKFKMVEKSQSPRAEESFEENLKPV